MRSNNNHGFDDDNGEYKVVMGDHIAYRYEVVDKLGSGSFGQVLRCHDYKTNADVALKLVRNKKRFFKQAQVEVDLLVKIRDADRADHSSIIHVQDDFVFRQHFCIAFPILSVNLYEATKLNKFQGFPLPLIRKIAVQMLGSLRFLRALRVVHCDLKPENILLERPGHSAIRVIDLGSGCYEDQRVYTYIQSRFYRAPEVILGLPYGHPIDMWSFACILSELYTGWPLFPGTNEHEQLLCVMEVFGTPPASLLATAKRANRFFDEDGEPIVVPFKGRMRMPGARTLQRAIDRKRPCEDTQFVDFLAACLAWQPHDRLTPDEALGHAWMADAPEALMQKARTAEPRSASPEPAETPPSPPTVPEEDRNSPSSDAGSSVQDDTQLPSGNEPLSKAAAVDAVAAAVAAATASTAPLDESMDDVTDTTHGASLSLQSSPPSPTSTARSGVQESALDSLIAQAHAAADAENKTVKGGGGQQKRRGMPSSRHAASHVQLPSAAVAVPPAGSGKVGPTYTGYAPSGGGSGGGGGGGSGGGGMRMSASTSVLPSAAQVRLGRGAAAGQAHHEADAYGGAVATARAAAEDSMPLAHPAAQADRAGHRQAQGVPAAAASAYYSTDHAAGLAHSASVASFALPAAGSMLSDMDAQSTTSSASMHRTLSGVSPGLQPSHSSLPMASTQQPAHLAPLAAAASSRGAYGLPRGGAHAAAVHAMASGGSSAPAVPQLNFAALSSSAQRAFAASTSNTGHAAAAAPSALYTSAHHQFSSAQHPPQHLPAVSTHRRHRIQVGTLRRTGSGHASGAAGSGAMAPLAAAGARLAAGQHSGSMYNISGRRRAQAAGSSLAPLPAASGSSASGSGSVSPRVSARHRPDRPTPRAAMGRSGGNLQNINTLTQSGFQPGAIAGGSMVGSVSARTPTSGGGAHGVRGASGSSTARAVSHGRAQLAALGGNNPSSPAHHVSYLRNSAARGGMPASSSGHAAVAHAGSRSSSLSRVPLRNRHVAGVHAYTRQPRR